MLKSYTYHFIFTIRLKNQKTLILDETRQQIHLWTPEEAKENSEEKDFTDPSCYGSFFASVGKKYIKFYNICGDKIVKIRKEEFSHIHMSRVAEIIDVPLKRLISECPSEKVLQYMRERLDKDAVLDLDLYR